MMLNCDLGESYGAWTMPVDAEIMVHIDMANIACGFHGGDPLTLQKAISLALEHNVTIGAHPSYPDLQGFGRRSLAMAEDELIACLHYQIAALDGMARAQGGHVEYVKPHGALYNDMMQDTQLRRGVLKAMACGPVADIPLMIQAHPAHEQLAREAAEFGVVLLFEAFADRRYTPDGYLMSRKHSGAVLNEDDAFTQATRLMDDGVIIACDDSVLSMPVDTLCVHGDSPGAVAMAEALRVALTKRKLSHVRPGTNA
ncbi:MAG: 5-oxoprolinase subunit PxpA [Alteromonadaceae bacterium]|nr:5-oxoprolinase subunit PxpA [Alteromonadaceae bacterium]